MSFAIPPIWLICWWLLWATQSLLSGWQVCRFLRLVRKQGKREDGSVVAYQPQAVVILPVKGVDERFDANLRGLFSQDYPAYRLLFVVESEQDPAHARLMDQLPELTAGSAYVLDARVLVAGLAERGGQKVHNQLHGLQHLTEADAVVAFADADAVPHARWLAELVYPLYKQRVGVTTGYRWLVPTDGRLSSQVASAINASVATMAESNYRNMAWGGSMAIRREQVAMVSQAWDGALSDDLQMTAVMRQAGLGVYFVGRLLIRSPVAMRWSQLLEFGRRQYVIVKVHRPLAWWFGLGANSFYTVSWLGCLAAFACGYFWALAALCLVMLLDRWRAWCREAVIHDAMGEDAVASLAGPIRLERWLTPIYVAVHAWLAISAVWGRTITWAGTRYRMVGPQDVRVLGRRAQD